MKPCHFTFIFLACFALNASAITKDTIYKCGDFLVEVSNKTHIDVVRQGAHLKHKTSRGDTLFENEKYVVLGDDTGITVYGIFRKFHLKHEFSAFATTVYKGKLAKPDFKTDHEAYGFRTQIRTQCKEYGINFAGHYTLVIWGCGSPCQTVAIIDRINGKIYYSKLPYINDELGFGVKYRPDSRLLLINSDLLERHKGYVSVSSLANLEAVEWINNKVKKLPK